jgi:hypothetical protein
VRKFVSVGAWQGTKRRGRYPAVEKEARTLNGVVFGSRIEMVRGAELMALARAGKIRDLSFHPRFEVEIRSADFCVYTADSSYNLPNGELVIEEVKSKATRLDPSYKLRRKAAELFYDMKVTEVIR